MICTRCNQEVGDCACPSRDEQLHDLAYDPNAHIAFKWCRGCDKHYARCRCEVPKFFLICGGKDMVWREGSPEQN